MLYYRMENQFIHVQKMLHLPVYVTLLKIYIKLPNWSFVFNHFSGFPGVFVSDEEMNGENYDNLLFIRFQHYKSINSFSLHKQIFPEHRKTCPS